jgi:hypothetical protein
MRPRGATVEAFLNRAHHAVVAEVEWRTLGGRRLPEPPRQRAAGTRL